MIPIERQYENAKAACGGALLLFEMGDFYEAFCDDAQTLARVLGLSLTTRKSPSGSMPMAGFPKHYVEAYLAKLVAAGHRVALCDRVTEKSQGAKIERHVVAPQADDPYTLVNDPPKPKPKEFVSTKTVQKKLISGMNCLPGQLDLIVGLDGAE